MYSQSEVVIVVILVTVMATVMVMVCRQQQLAMLVFAGIRWSHLHTSEAGDKILRVQASQGPMKRWENHIEMLLSERVHIDMYNIEVVSYQYMFYRSACIISYILY